MSFFYYLMFAEIKGSSRSGLKKFPNKSRQFFIFLETFSKKAPLQIPKTAREDYRCRNSAPPTSSPNNKCDGRELGCH